MGRHFDAPNSTMQIKLSLRAEEQRLKTIFVSLRRFWMTWSWPVMSLKEPIDDNSDVPLVNAKYKFSTECKNNFQTEAFFGVDNNELPEIVSCEPKRVPAYLWKSFVANIRLDGGGTIENVMNETEGIHYLYFSRLRRLPIFCHLSMGKRMSVNSVLHLLNKSVHICCAGAHRNESKLTIESLFNEWKIVEAHFERNQGGASIRSSQSLKGT